MDVVPRPMSDLLLSNINAQTLVGVQAPVSKAILKRFDEHFVHLDRSTSGCQPVIAVVGPPLQRLKVELAAVVDLNSLGQPMTGEQMLTGEGALIAAP